MPDPFGPPTLLGPAGGPPPEAGRPKRSYRGAWIATAAAVTALLMLGGAVVWFSKPQPPPVSVDNSTSPAPSDTRNPNDVLKAMFQTQSAALVKGDEQGWLAPVDASNKKLHDQYREGFRTLRALRVTSWQVDTGLSPIFAAGGGETKMRITVGYCFDSPSCPPVSRSDVRAPQFTQELKLRFDPTNLKQPFLITESVASTQDRHAARPLPWETPGLTFRDGKRVTIAAPPSQVKRLSELVRLADRAAAVADKFARASGQALPERYVVFPAGDKEWSIWRGGGKGKNVLGYAYQSGEVRSDVVLRMSTLGTSSALESTLRHEFGHVVTVTGSDSENNAVSATLPEWFTEGIAEYIDADGRSPARNNRINDVRSFLRSGKWSKDLRPVMPGPNASIRDVSAFYGLSYLATSCMADQYGEATMLKWWFEMAHGGVNGFGGLNIDTASEKYYKTDWAGVTKVCVPYIRRIANG